ncbi:hypothetical protein F1880_003570 [Penicillium rolfsii]|nr:hypothetical protein F1880_003570 [Penicillium rolfsii]
MIQTASTTSSTPVTSGPSGIAANSCPSKNLITVTSADFSIFTLLCAVDRSRGEPASSGNEAKIFLAALFIRCNLALQIVPIGIKMISMSLHARVSFILPTWQRHIMVDRIEIAS